MYKSRAEMKALAKEAFLSRYWLCVSVLLLYSLIIGAGSYTGIIAVLLAGPLEVGVCAFAIRLQQGAEVSVATMFTSAFDHNFGRKLGGACRHGTFREVERAAFQDDRPAILARIVENERPRPRLIECRVESAAAGHPVNCQFLSFIGIERDGYSVRRAFVFVSAKRPEDGVGACRVDDTVFADGVVDKIGLYIQHDAFRQRRRG